MPYPSPLNSPNKITNKIIPNPDPNDQKDDQATLPGVKPHGSSIHESLNGFTGLFARFMSAIRSKPHDHSHTPTVSDPALATQKGILALKISLIALLATGLFQVVIVVMSGSVALLADTLHNFSDILTVFPLWIAFRLAQRARNRRYTYGYGRAEDLAGIFILLLVIFNAGLVFYESIHKILQPQPLSNIGLIALAAIVGFIGNELVAIYRMRVGHEIGSAALVADGLHARTDALTSLGVLAGAIGVWLGFPIADPLVGLIIGFVILSIAFSVARELWSRVMDATDPKLIEKIETITRSIDGVLDVHNVALRWVGHRQRGELHITVDCNLPIYESNQVTQQVRASVQHILPTLDEITIQVDPCKCNQSSGCKFQTDSSSP